MRRIFADAVYWVAIAHRKDQWHQKARQVSQQLGQVTLITTDEVLPEFLAHVGAFGPEMRTNCGRFVRDLLNDPTTKVIEQSRQSFLAGLDLYQKRQDKDYSLTDCIAMVTMRQEGITEALTHDRHFTQEGFTILF